MSKNNSDGAVNKPHTTAGAAFLELLQIWSNPKKLFIVGRDDQSDEHPICFYDADDRMKYRGKRRAFSNLPLGRPVAIRTPGFGSMLRLPSKN